MPASPTTKSSFTALTAAACCCYCCILSLQTAAFILPPTPSPAVHLFPNSNNEDGLETTTQCTTTTPTSKGAPPNANIIRPANIGNTTCTLKSSLVLNDNNNNNATATAVVIIEVGQEDSDLSLLSKNNDDEDNSNELDFVGAGTLGDIMSGSGRRTSMNGIMDDDAIFTNHPTISASATTVAPIITPAAVIDGLVTKEGGELNSRFNCNFTPMERIALTANGNLQRIFSSYYDAPVHVHVDSCARRQRRLQRGRRERKSNENCFSTILEEDAAIRFNENNDVRTSLLELEKNGSNAQAENDEEIAIWDRVVHLTIHNNHTLCKATSIIRVNSPTCIQLIESGTVGLGQMFRYLNKLPTFSLLDAGKRGSFSGSPKKRTRAWNENEVRCGEESLIEVEDEEFNALVERDDENEFLHDGEEGGGMWRTYKLQCEEMTCLIHEEFHRDAWELL